MEKLEKMTTSSANFELMKKLQRIERAIVLNRFKVLATQFEEKANEDDGETSLVWTAAAASLRRVCDEANDSG